MFGLSKKDKAEAITSALSRHDEQAVERLIDSQDACSKLCFLRRACAYGNKPAIVVIARSLGTGLADALLELNLRDTSYILPVLTVAGLLTDDVCQRITASKAGIMQTIRLYYAGRLGFEAPLPGGGTIADLLFRYDAIEDPATYQCFSDDELVDRFILPSLDIDGNWAASGRAEIAALITKPIVRELTVANERAARLVMSYSAACPMLTFKLTNPDETLLLLGEQVLTEDICIGLSRLFPEGPTVRPEHPRLGHALIERLVGLREVAACNWCARFVGPVHVGKAIASLAGQQGAMDSLRFVAEQTELLAVLPAEELGRLLYPQVDPATSRYLLFLNDARCLGVARGELADAYLRFIATGCIGTGAAKPEAPQAPDDDRVRYGADVPADMLGDVVAALSSVEADFDIRSGQGVKKLAVTVDSWDEQHLLAAIDAASLGRLGWQKN